MAPDKTHGHNFKAALERCVIVDVANVNVSVVVQLWQIVFSAVIGCGALVSLGFWAASTFITKNDCKAREIDNRAREGTGEKKIDDIFNIISIIQQDVAFLKGKVLGAQ